MTVTTSAKFNADALQAALPASAAFTSAGGDLASANAKAVTFYGTDDTTGQVAIATAAGQFTDRAANQSTLQSRASAALIANATFLGLASPTNAQTVAQVQTLTKECNALIRLLLNQLDSTLGT